MNLSKWITDIRFKMNIVFLISCLLCSYSTIAEEEEFIPPEETEVSDTAILPGEEISVPPDTMDSPDSQITTTDSPDMTESPDPAVSSLSKPADLSDEERLNFVFLNLTTIHSSVTGMGYGGDFGYGRSLVSKGHYFGFFEAGLGLIGLLSPGFIFKYGYVFMRKHKLSIGFNGIISPVLWTNNLPFLFLNEDFHLLYGIKLFIKINISKISDFLIRFGVMYASWPLSNPQNMQWNTQAQWNQWNQWNQQWVNQQYWLGSPIWIDRRFLNRNFNLGIGIRAYF